MRIPKRFIPGFPSSRFKWLEKRLRDLHLMLFRRHYDVFIPPFADGAKGVYIWNGGSVRMATDDIVSAQPMAAPCDLPWEFVSSQDAEEGDLLAQINDKWRAYFLALGQPGEEERLTEIEEMTERAVRVAKARG